MAELEFKLPKGMEVDEDEIHERMLQGAPRNYDVSEGSLFFDATRPTAEEKSRMINFNLAIAMQMMFPQFAEDDFLDYHGEAIRLYRHPAEKAKGFVTFIGEPKTTIPTGTIILTAGSENDSPIRFETTEIGVLDGEGKVRIPILATEPGSIGNVPAGTIIALDESINGITSIYNENRLTDGAEEESDDLYRERIMDRRKNQALSGARRDYKSWALEIEGVGNAIVIPEADGFGTGTTKVLITPRDGGTASEELINSVQQYIAPDGRDGGGLAPIGAKVVIGTVEQLQINISFSRVELPDGTTEQEAFDAFKEALKQYFSELPEEGIIRYTGVGSIAVGTGLIKDYDELKLNGRAENIQLTQEQVATVGRVEIKDD